MLFRLSLAGYNFLDMYNNDCRDTGADSAKAPAESLDQIACKELHVPSMKNLVVNSCESSSWITEASSLQALLRRHPVHSRQVLQSYLVDSDWTVLENRGLLRRVTNKPKAFARIFTVNEPLKNRRRLIVHPQLINKLIKDSGDVPKAAFTSMPSLHSLMAEKKYFLSIDMKCYFYQFPLCESVQAFFGAFRVTKEGDRIFYVFTKLPMGFSLAPKIANDMTMFLATEAGFNEYAVCIDNLFVFTYSKEEAEALKERFLQVANTYRVTLSQCEVLRSGNVLGAFVDLEAQTVNVPEKTRTEHKEIFQRAQADSRQRTEDWWKISSLIIWCMWVRQIPFGRFLEPIRLMSRIGRHTHLQWHTFPHWELTGQQHQRMKTAIDAVLGPPSRLRKRPISRTDGELYSDACDTGYGIVSVFKNVEVWTRRWSRDEADLHINVKELIALREAVQIAKNRNLQNPCFYVDSQVVLAQIQRRYSLDWLTNSHIQSILNYYDHIDIRWIPSEDNLADEPSRR